MAEVDWTKPLLPGTYEVPVNTFFYLLTPPGPEEVRLGVVGLDGLFYEQDIWGGDSGAVYWNQGVFDNKMQFLFNSGGVGDKFTILLDYDIPYLMPVWTIQLIRRGAPTW